MCIRLSARSSFSVGCASSLAGNGGERRGNFGDIAQYMNEAPIHIEIEELFNQTLREYSSEDEQEKQIPHPVAWISENFIDPVTGDKVKLESHQKRILRKALQTDENGISRYSLVVWSEPKKSGKTAIAAAVGAYVACNLESPNEISTVANDQEQSAGRIFAAMLPTLDTQGWSIPVSEKSVKRQPSAYGPNGSIVHAITTNYEKEAGANPGISLWSELWAYKTERLNRLWEEMTPPPTRKFRMRWVETYAGFIGESLLLQSLYLRIFKDFTEKELQPGVVKIWPDLPVYELGSTLVYWSHDHRMPWQTESYYDDQRADLRVQAFIRLHTNRWVESSDTFISYPMWQASLREVPQAKPATYAIDGSKNGDCTVLVGCYREDDKIHTSPESYIWVPEEGKEIPFKRLENKIVELHKKKLLRLPVYYDPYQMVYMAQRLRELGISCEEFSQASARIKSDTFLFKLYNERNIFNCDKPNMRRHVLAAAAKMYDNHRLRIIKPNDEQKPQQDESEEEEELVKKVDFAVGQSMAAYMAWHRKEGGWGASGV